MGLGIYLSNLVKDLKEVFTKEELKNMGVNDLPNGGMTIDPTKAPKPLNKLLKNTVKRYGEN